MYRSVMSLNDESKLFRCIITMDYQSTTEKITVTRRAPNKAELKNNVEKVLNSNDAVVSLADVDEGFKTFNSMKFGHIDTVEKVDRNEK